MVTEHCVSVDAGAVQLVVKARQLTNEILADTYRGWVRSDIDFDDFDDFGASLHVSGTGFEYLRFDYFENEPHYHYRACDGRQRRRSYRRIDRRRCHRVLAHVRRAATSRHGDCGVSDLADEVERQMDTVTFAVTAVRDLMTRARHAVG
jgi:hypothetical protein